MIYVLDLVNYKQRIYDALIGDYFAEGALPQEDSNQIKKLINGAV